MKNIISDIQDKLNAALGTKANSPNSTKITSPSVSCKKVIDVHKSTQQHAVSTTPNTTNEAVKKEEAKIAEATAPNEGHLN